MGSGASSQGETWSQDVPRHIPKSLKPGTYYVDPYTQDIYIYQDKTATTEAQQNHDEEGYFTLPWPRPPARSRDQIFNAKAYKNVDEHAKKIPLSAAAKDYTSLVQQLVSVCKKGDEVGRVRALFTWLTSQNPYDMFVSDLPASNSPLDHLLQIRFGTNARARHSYIFYQLCKFAGIETACIRGINKSAAYRIGESMNRRDMSSTWNAVYVAGEWRLIDAFWASSCKVAKNKEWQLLEAAGEQVDEKEEDNDDGTTSHCMNEFFFMPDPKYFIYTHLPDDKVWQLLEEPWTFEMFEKSMYIRERSHELGMEFRKEISTCRLTVPNGEIELCIKIPNDRWAKQVYQYLFFKQGREDVGVNKFVMYEKRQGILKYKVTFPVTGLYQIQVFGHEVGLFSEEDSALTFMYLFDVTKAKSKAKPLPDDPFIGWGPGAEAEAAGLKPLTHKDSIIETSDGLVEIRLRSVKVVNMLQNVLADGYSGQQLRRYCLIRKEGDEYVISLRLPHAGDFALKLHAAQQENNKGQLLDNVCNYLVRVLRGDTEIEMFPEIANNVLGLRPEGEKLKVKAVPENSGLVRSDDGLYTLRLQKAAAANLVCHLTNNKVSCQTNVTREEANGEVLFNFRLPRTGEYGINIYNASKGQALAQNVYNGLLVANKSATDASCDDKENVDVNRITVYQAKSALQIPTVPGNALGTIIQRLSTHTKAKMNIERQREGDNVKVDLPEHGEYEVTIHSEENGVLTPRHVFIINYVAVVENKFPKSKLSAEEQEAERLMEPYLSPIRDAMAAEGAQALEAALQQFYNSGLDDPRGRIDRAKHFHQYLIAKDLLSRGMQTKNIGLLEKGIAMAERDNKLAQKLGIQLPMAKRTRDSLHRINKLRHAVMNLNQKTVAELKSYSTPPEIVYSVMKATFLLLGNKPKEMKEWNQLKILLNKTGKDSLKRRIDEFNVDELDPHLASKIKPMLQYDLNVVRDTSAGAAAFFLWSQGMVEEAESRS